LEGTIISLLAQSTLNEQTINLELARKIVSNLVGSPEAVAEKHNIQNIIRTVCSYFNVSADQIQSSSRKREIVQARQTAMYFANKLTDETLTTIGSSIGKRNHATVLHACKTVGDLIETDKQFRHFIEEIEQKLTL
jgi:chromosomal replication initiator protein